MKQPKKPIPKSTPAPAPQDKKTIEDYGKFSLRPDQVRRSKPDKAEVEAPEQPKSVSAGAIDRVIDFTFNPSPEKIREVTNISTIQGRLLPQLDVVDCMWQHLIEVATYRQDAGNYKSLYHKARPEAPKLIQEFIYRTAQWQKSVAGANLKSAVDLALAETESRAGQDDSGIGDPWKEGYKD